MKGKNEDEEARTVLENMEQEDDQQQAEKEEAAELAEEFADDDKKEQHGAAITEASALGENDDEMTAEALLRNKQGNEDMNIEDELNPLQKYALHFLEKVSPVTEQEHVDALKAQLQAKFESKEKDWDLCNDENKSEDDEDNNNNDDNNNNNSDDNNDDE